MLPEGSKGQVLKQDVQVAVDIMLSHGPKSCDSSCALLALLCSDPLLVQEGSAPVCDSKDENRRWIQMDEPSSQGEVQVRGLVHLLGPGEEILQSGPLLMSMDGRRLCYTAALVLMMTISHTDKPSAPS